MSISREISGACADIGMTIPLLFVLANSGFDAAILLFGWGAAYVWSSWHFKVPVSVQPLKSMLVMTAALNITMPTLAAAGLLFGAVLVALSKTTILQKIQLWLSAGIVRGIQALTGIGLGLVGISIFQEYGFTLLNSEPDYEVWTVVFVGVIAASLFLFERIRAVLVLGLLIFGLSYSLVGGSSQEAFASAGVPDMWWSSWALIRWDHVLMLIVSQLPLTLANAVFAAEQTYKDFEVSSGPTSIQLASNIGFMGLVLPIIGCFPTCHGSGGIAAHLQGGASSYKSTAGLGIVYMGCAFFAGFGVIDVLLGIPIVIFVALLLADAARMVSFVGRLQHKRDWIVLLFTVVVGGISQNLAVGVVAGIVSMSVLNFLGKDESHG